MPQILSLQLSRILTTLRCQKDDGEQKDNIKYALNLHSCSPQYFEGNLISFEETKSTFVQGLK